METRFYNLKNLLEIKYGKNQKNIEEPHGKYPILGTGGVIGHTNQFLYDKPSVLIGRKGTIEKIQYIEQPFWTIDTLFYTIINEKLIIPKFLYYRLLLVDLTLYNEGTSIPSLTTKTLYKLEIDIPTVNIQKKILKILNNLDKKIEINKKINKNLNSLLRSLFKHWIINYQIPKSFNINHTYRETKKYESIEMPDDWVIFNFKDKCNFIKGKKPKKIYKFHENNTISYLTIDVLKGQENIYGTIENTIPVTKNDILIVSDGASSGDLFFGKEGILGSTLSKIEIPTEYTDIILEYLKYYSKQIKKNNTGSAIPHVDKGFILNLQLALPKDSKYIKNIFQQIHNKIINNNEEIESLRKLRDTLLPKLMSGEIDVSQVEV